MWNWKIRELGNLGIGEMGNWRIREFWGFGEFAEFWELGKRGIDELGNLENSGIWGIGEIGNWGFGQFRYSEILKSKNLLILDFGKLQI